MARGHKFSLCFLESFRICCTKNPNSSVKSPLPVVTYTFTSTNSKSFDISVPIHPDPPPSRPYDSTSLSYGEYQSEPCMTHKKIDKQRSSSNRSYPNITEESDDPIVAASTNGVAKEKLKKKKSKARCENETEFLFSSPTSFHSSCSYDYHLKTVYETPMDGGKKTMKQKITGSTEEALRECEFTEKSCLVERTKVYDSFVVVKRSVNPLEDFKESMLEMIVDKQMSEPKELEELLMSFLSLNSRMHHKVIVEAFAQIWQELRCGSLLCKTRN